MESNRFWRQLDLCPPDKLTFPIAAQVKAFAVGEPIHREVLFDIPRMRVMASM